MITTRQELHECKEIERRLCYVSSNWGGYLPLSFREQDIIWKYLKLLRNSEFHNNTGHKIRHLFNSVRLKRIQNKYSLHIPENTCDTGLSIAHVGPIIIHHKCHIGRNLRIHVGVNIGANGGPPPVLGNNVYIGPGAKIYGNIKIADGVKIGANAVVNKSCMKENITLAGVPASEVIQ